MNSLLHAIVLLILPESFLSALEIEQWKVARKTAFMHHVFWQYNHLESFPFESMRAIDTRTTTTKHIRYGTTSLGWFPSSPHGPYGCSLWRYILRCWERFFPYFSFERGDGFTISFWHNRWYGEGPLKELFPGLFALAVNKNTSVAGL